MPEEDFTEQIEIQDVWRHMSANKNSMGGYLVWEVRQVIGKPHRMYENMFESPDGGHIYVSCNFFFEANTAAIYAGQQEVYSDIHIV